MASISVLTAVFLWLSVNIPNTAVIASPETCHESLLCRLADTDSVSLNIPSSMLTHLTGNSWLFGVMCWMFLQLLADCILHTTELLLHIHLYPVPSVTSVRRCVFSVVPDLWDTLYMPCSVSEYWADCNQSLFFCMYRGNRRQNCINYHHPEYVWTW